MEENKVIKGECLLKLWVIRWLMLAEEDFMKRFKLKGWEISWVALPSQVKLMCIHLWLVWSITTLLQKSCSMSQEIHKNISVSCPKLRSTFIMFNDVYLV